MPKLRERATDGGYYTQAAVLGAGAVATWQISDAGAERIFSHGYALGEEFPRSLFNELVEGGEAWTGGGGIAVAADFGLYP